MVIKREKIRKIWNLFSRDTEASLFHNKTMMIYTLKITDPIRGGAFELSSILVSSSGLYSVVNRPLASIFSGIIALENKLKFILKT